MLSKEEIENAKDILNNYKFLFSKNIRENADTYISNYYTKVCRDSMEILLQYIDQLEQENINLKIVLDRGLDKNKKYCFNEDGNTGKCLGYSNVDDDEPCEYCKSCEALSIGDENIL